MITQDLVIFSLMIEQLAVGIFCRLLAKSKNADEFNAFFAGLIFGIIALLYYVGIPKRDEIPPKKGFEGVVAFGCGFVIWLILFGLGLSAILSDIGIQ